MKAWGRKFFFILMCFTAAVVMLSVGKLTGTEFVTSLLGLAGMYITGNVLERKPEVKDGNGKD